MQLAGGEHAGEGAHWHTMLSVAASATVAVTVDERGESRHSTWRSRVRSGQGHEQEQEQVGGGCG
jgi:hypothetical protein